MYRSFSALPQERANYWRGEAYVFKGVGGSSAGSHPFPSPGRLRLRRFEGGLPEEEGFLKDLIPLSADNPTSKATWRGERDRGLRRRAPRREAIEWIQHSMTPGRWPPDTRIQPPCAP
jgi:hypothetical protein